MHDIVFSGRAGGGFSDGMCQAASAIHRAASVWALALIVLTELASLVGLRFSAP